MFFLLAKNGFHHKHIWKEIYIYNKYKTVVFDLSVFCVQSSILRILNEHLNTTLKKIFD